MSLLRWIAVTGLLLVSASAQAGTIHPALQAEMDATAPDATVSVLVYMAEQAPIAGMNQELRAEKATMLQRHSEVITALQSTASRTQADLRTFLDSGIRNGSVQGYTSYWIMNAFVVDATKEAIRQIAARIDVDQVEPNYGVSLIEPVEMHLPPVGEEAYDGPRGIGVTPGLRAIRAPEVWYQLGYNGAGRVLANLDTGVDGNHPALRDRWRGVGGQHPWQECWLDVLGTGTTFPTDTYGHGTHVMGTIAGLGAATNDTIGVSWGAQWIATNAINQGVGGGFDADVITCLQWLADPDGNPNTIDDVPDVVQNSWRINEGFGQGYTDCDSRWWAAIDNCEAAGVVTTWSAGNEGPGAQTIGSPPDRAATAYNTLSVGAVDATNYQWPYPIAGFSSRGPTGCNVAPELKTKPEVSAPGVDVYSSIPGGGYDGTWDGTSMAGPHVAGIVGLIRQANPNLDVDSVKEILMSTARDEGTTGEDNTYGWGFVDAYAAVIAATVGFGHIEGTVSNASWNDAPLPGARVRLIEANTNYLTNAEGHYSGSAPAGSYTAEASLEGFQPQTVDVVIVANEMTVQDFALVDIAGPTITGVSQPGATNDIVGPYSIDATITDPSTIGEARLYYRLNGGSWIQTAMTQNGAVYTGSIPGMPAGTQIEYYVWAKDGVNHESSSDTYALFITEPFLFYDAEADAGWQLGASGDGATSGIWIRDDPVGTNWNGAPVQPEDDHTDNPAHICFVTGNGSVGGAAGDQDVDGGCTTLLSPIFDLSAAEFAFVNYWRWWGENGNSTDDEFAADVSNDGGATWHPLEREPENAASWQKTVVQIDAIVPLTDQMRFRFQACDLNTPGLVEAAVDDFAIDTFTPNPAGAPDGSGLLTHTRLSQNEPNPFNPVTKIRFSLATAGDARLAIYDASGRLVRVLHDGPMGPGTHEALWNGLDEQGRPVGSGVYFYQLDSGAFHQSRRMTILK